MAIFFRHHHVNRLRVSRLHCFLVMSRYHCRNCEKSCLCYYPMKSDWKNVYCWDENNPCYYFSYYCYSRPSGDG